MSWSNLEEDVADMFSRMSGFLDFEAEDGGESEGLPDGYHAHEHLTMNRKTTHEYLTPCQKVSNRKALEEGRRAYKTMKQREYYARKRAA